VELESVQIAAADVAAATRSYEVLLGVAAVQGPLGPRLPLATGAVDIIGGEPGLASIRFLCGAGVSAPPLTEESFHGLRVLLAEDGGRGEEVGGGALAEGPRSAAAIDHVVVNTADVERAIGLWRDRCGLRLALDREFPQRGLRLVFFRSGGITLEIAGGLGAAPDPRVPDRFWGVAYRVPDLPAWRERLLGAGVAVSQIRPGQKRDTVVATVKSHAAGVPTLLLMR